MLFNQVMSILELDGINEFNPDPRKYADPWI